MRMARHGSFRNPIRLLLHVPVPWVFVLTYLVGAGLEFARSLVIPTGALIGVVVAGGVLFAVGAVIAGLSLLIFRAERTTTVPGRGSSQLVTWGLYQLS